MIATLGSYVGVGVHAVRESKRLTPPTSERPRCSLRALCVYGGLFRLGSSLAFRGPAPTQHPNREVHPHSSMTQVAPTITQNDSMNPVAPTSYSKDTKSEPKKKKCCGKCCSRRCKMGCAALCCLSIIAAIVMTVVYFAVPDSFGNGGVPVSDAAIVSGYRRQASNPGHLPRRVAHGPALAFTILARTGTTRPSSLGAHSSCRGAARAAPAPRPGR